MYKPQFAKDEKEPGSASASPSASSTGKRRVGHGGAIYGFATDLSALPDDKLGVVVVAVGDCANAVTTRIADARAADACWP